MASWCICQIYHLLVFRGLCEYTHITLYRVGYGHIDHNTIDRGCRLISILSRIHKHIHIRQPPMIDYGQVIPIHSTSNVTMVITHIPRYTYIYIYIYIYIYM